MEFSKVLRNVKRLAVVLLVYNHLIFFNDSSAQSGTLYWIENEGHSLLKASIETLEIDTIRVVYSDQLGDSVISDITINPDSYTLYWIHSIGGIYRADLFGDNVFQIDSTRACGLGYYSSLAVDGLSELLFAGQTSDCGGNIHILDLNGNERSSVFAQGGLSASHLTIDPSENQLFFVYDEPPRALYRTNYDGTDLIKLSEGTAKGIALDSSNHKIYWVENQAIFQANYDGSSRVELIDSLSSPFGLVVDPVGALIYWTDLEDGVINKMNLDGTKAQEVFSGLSGPTKLTMIQKEVRVGVSYDGLENVQIKTSIFPNPFSSLTTLSYSLQENTWVSIKVFDTLGREVTTLVNEFQSQGIRSVTWDASSSGELPSGVYLYKIDAIGQEKVGKMMLVK